MKDKNKKTKKQIKVQDLKPKKDAKGGFNPHTNTLTNTLTNTQTNTQTNQH
jgi:hypothetical protein